MLFLMMLSAAVAPGDGKTMGMDDWQQMTITSVAAAQAPNGTHHVRVAAGDLDGDGVADEAILALACNDGTLTAARYIIAPRDSTTGMASGKRQHNPVRFIKEWGPASPQLQAVRPTYDVKTMKGNEKRVRGWDPVKKEEIAALDSDAQWTAITLRATDGLCPATADAALRATKTRSNIQNN